MSDGGKGDNRRPTDQKKFDENYDKIFGKKKHCSTCLGGASENDHRCSTCDATYSAYVERPKNLIATPHKENSPWCGNT